MTLTRPHDPFSPHVVPPVQPPVFVTADQSARKDAALKALAIQAHAVEPLSPAVKRKAARRRASGASAATKTTRRGKPTREQMQAAVDKLKGEQ